MRIRLLKRFSVYVLFVAFGLTFWWLAENSSGLFPQRSGERKEGLPQTGPGSDTSDPSPELFGTKTLNRHVDRVLKGESLSVALSRNGFSAQEAHLVANLLKSEINLRLIHPGDAFIIERKTGSAANSSFDAFELIRIDAAGIPIRYRIEPKAEIPSALTDAKKVEDFRLTRLQTKVSLQQESLSGSIESSLYDGILFAGGDAPLVNRFSELFGWQIDFYRETQRGDKFKMLVETKYADGRFAGYGRVKAAEYITGNKIYRGFYYESSDGQNSGIYDEKGMSLEKTFFKSPLELTRITSRYGQRFHPVLGKLKKHNGIDYGASTGTPFWAVADGVVLEARYSPTAGNMVRIKHRNGYVTEYFHASKIAHGVRAGAKVKQKQVIGYVGTTGRSTGPHLHFGMMLDKSYVDPSKQNFPKGNLLPKKELARFFTTIGPLVAELQKTSVGSS